MGRVRIDEGRCKGCGVCASVCPPGILRFSERVNRLGYHPVVVTEEERCTGCTRCVLMCPDLVITVERPGPFRRAKAGAALV